MVWIMTGIMVGTVVGIVVGIMLRMLVYLGYEGVVMVTHDGS